MNWQRNDFGRLVKRVESEPLSPTASKASSDSWSSIALSNTIATMNPLENNPVRSLKDYLHPTRTATPSCIMFPANIPQLDFKPGMIQLLPTFHGLDSENPYLHIREFEEVVATFHSQPNVLDSIRLKFFPFSLKDKAKSWLYSLRPRSIGTWAEMTEAFFNKYFPHHKTNNLKRQISTFSQKDSETLYQAWERFKELLNMCPHHGYENWRIVSYFYEGLTPRERQFIEMMCNGDFLLKDPDEAIDYLNDLAEKAHTWTGPSIADSTNRSKAGGIYYLREEDNLKSQVEVLSRKLQALETKDSKIPQTVARVESQDNCFVCGGVDHLAQERGKIPSQPHPNPMGQHMAETSKNAENVKEVNAVTTRSGKVLDEPTLPSPPVNKSSTNPDDALLEEKKKKPPIHVPFPQALQTGKLPGNHGEILEHLQQVKVNLPLLHMIKQVPAYAKVIKDLCTMKKKHNVKKTAFLTEQVSAVIEQKTPPKYKDPGCPTISCHIGTHEFGHALLDLGASVNLMPYSVYLRLGLGEIKPTSVVLQLADRSVRKPRGVVEDVLLQIDKFYYPVDFIVLDTQSMVDMESKIPLILGRPFLATANALINCRNGLMKLTFGNMTLEVNIFHIGRQPHQEDECYHTCMIDSLMPEELHLKDDSHDKSMKFWPPHFEELTLSIMDAPNVDLSPLLKGLKHAFLGPGLQRKLHFVDNG
ncbi:hypothetical protein ACOSP7_019198 [Xanthoceras sorbifolium]